MHATALEEGGPAAAATHHQPPMVWSKPFPLLRRTMVNALAMGLVEVLVLGGTLVLGGIIRYFWKGDPMVASWMWYLLLAWITGAWFSKLLPGWGLGPIEELRRSVLLIVAVFIGATAMLFWGKQAHETSRFTLTMAFLLSLVLVPLVRLQVKRTLIRLQQWGLPTAIYADADSGPRIIEALQQEQGLGYVPVCVFTDDPPRTGGSLAGIPIVGRTHENNPNLPAALLAMPGAPRERIADMLEGNLSVYRNVIVIPDLLEAPSLWVKPRDLVGMLGLEISSNLLDPLARVIKRSFDIAATLLLAPVWIPLCAVLALLVWLGDRAHPLFLQERVGMKGRTFQTWKFRTMHPDAETILMAKLQKDDALRQEWEQHFKLRRDPRITPIGRFLRRTSLDELPQLVNVLRGEMSLVGPRPLPRYHYEELPDRVRKLRDRVRPGITGLWQVSGRSEAGHAAMPKWDTYYVRNWSVWLDIVVFFRTIRTVVSGHGAY